MSGRLLRVSLLAAPLAVLLMMCGCTVNLAPSDSQVQASGAYTTVEGTVWRSAASCDKREGRIFGGSQLVFMDTSGAVLAKATLGSSCYPVSEILGARQMTGDPNIVTALFAQALKRRGSYQVAFVPGPNFGDRAAPAAPMSVSYEELDAAGFRMDFDTGSDSQARDAPGSAGPGIVLGPRLCQGFPAPGCDP